MLRIIFLVFLSLSVSGEVSARSSAEQDHASREAVSAALASDCANIQFRQATIYGEWNYSFDKEGCILVALHMPNDERFVIAPPTEEELRSDKINSALFRLHGVREALEQVDFPMIEKKINELEVELKRLLKENKDK